MCNSIMCPHKQAVKPATLSDLVRELETKASHTEREVSDAKATLLLNFGPEGRTQAGLVRSNQPLTAMICNVFEHYSDALRQANLAKHELQESHPFE